MRVVILHAYSSTNSGDGLLVDEAIRLAEAANADCEIVVLALDPDSFSAHDRVRFIHPLTGTSRTPSSFAAALLALIAIARGSRLPPTVRRLIASADVAVGVGGGYLRGSTLSECAKMLLVHYPQLHAARLNQSTVYLPQSIGPFSGAVKKLMLRRLRRISRIFVRDDRSAAYLDSLANVTRAPDTALLALATESTEGVEDLSRTASNKARVGLVARALLTDKRRSDLYAGRITKLNVNLDAKFLIQARARGNDDGAFYRSTLGVTASETLAKSTSAPQRSVDVVVSVRLHGAIQSIRNGVPAIHLSYERKGWGAFQNLGLDDYVHNALDFDPDLVAEQARRLGADSSRYWEAVESRRLDLSRAEHQIVTALRTATK